jgi:CRP-like cAMP-binding protein
MGGSNQPEDALSWLIGQKGRLVLVHIQRTVVGENRLLAALPAGEYISLLPRLESVHLRRGQVIQEPSDSVRYAYFLRTGMLSQAVLLEDGASVEVGTVGNEGMLGLSLFHASAVARTRTVCQLPSEALRLVASAFQELIRGSDAVHYLLHRYVQARYEQLIQTAACNRHHSTKARCARWLLTTQDRAQADRFPLTHEFLSGMLDVRRATITLTANALQQEGYIRYSRGQLTILDRPGLERTACECYRTIKQIYDRLFGEPDRMSGGREPAPR